VDWQSNDIDIHVTKMKYFRTTECFIVDGVNIKDKL
jgi:hypothetical protein